MQNCTYAHLSITDKKTGLNQEKKKMKLLNGLKLRLIKITGLSFLSSMTTLSILNIADTSVAFEAKVKNCGTDLCLTTYYLPLNTGNAVAKVLTFPPQTDVEILFCRLDGTWCYLQGYKLKDELPILMPRWVRQDGLCKSNLSASFLQSCKNNNLREVVDEQNLTQKLFCADNNQPLLWFDDKITQYLCPPTTETNTQTPKI